ncbi:hypothetical protein DESUT3_15310 [Desulfuromonas versatilis]|uniref:Ribbon-helix-helix protein CopG domain-containing protein n=1 Tax=Desulfuromonas versatilis TaxID=2802975 RepID=A0ABM8HRB9_9BACT|nr:ribbon-helix-helix protein, CopG family [Desulfuromonas versatilis]BCR04462.1 hypothetical protein DESUT3_15310 [Desulfuromonas versatilis]
MGRPAKNPKKYIVSCRIDDDEMETLKRLAARGNTNISDLLRLSLDLLAQDGAPSPGNNA